MLERPNLATRLAAQLESDIRRGHWRSKLPGTRILSESYRVSRDTVIEALDLLTKQGLLLPAELRKARRIDPKAIRPKANSKHEYNQKLLIIHDAATTLDHNDALILRGMQDIWEKYHGPATWVRADFLRYKQPDGLLTDLISRYSADALLLNSPSVAWTRASTKLLPTYFNGGEVAEDAQISMSAFSTIEQLSSLLSLFIQLGHQRILIPNTNADSVFTKQAVKILKELLPPPALGTHEDLSPTFSEAQPEVWKSYWKREFTRLRPTAIILYSVKHLLSFYSFCSANSIDIPGQVSVIYVGYDSQLEWLSPRPTMMRYPSKLALRHFHEWINYGLKPIGLKLLDLELVEGESTAPPAP